jgi:hypothetical protein
VLNEALPVIYWNGVLERYRRPLSSSCLQALSCIDVEHFVTVNRNACDAQSSLMDAVVPLHTGLVCIGWASVYESERLRQPH